MHIQIIFITEFFNDIEYWVMLCSEFVSGVFKKKWEFLYLKLGIDGKNNKEKYKDNPFQWYSILYPKNKDFST